MSIHKHFVHLGVFVEKSQENRGRHGQAVTLWLIILFIFANSLHAQELSNLRQKSVYVEGDSLVLDSLSVIPSSFTIKNKQGQAIPDSLFRLDPASATLYLENNTKDSFLLEYRVFRINFSKPYYHKDINRILPTEKNYRNTFKYTPEKSTNLWKDAGNLNKSGNIMRGISFGNSQNAIVNSNLNLQLSGKINPKISILAAITDDNIPLQPDGNSQQIQDFDKVFIQLFSEQWKLVAGDFELQSPHSSFMKYYRKTKGVTFHSSQDIKKGKYQWTNSVSGSVAKGKYARNSFNGTEGVQGPYRLKGAHNESYIIILAGSEKVYIDGKLLERGNNRHYTMDYNMAELTFTAKIPITKNKRIVVEFEYSEQNFTRFLFTQNNQLKTPNATFWLNLYSEQDAKNQMLQQQLNQSQKHFLYNIGDSLQKALVPNVSYIDSSRAAQNQVLYKLIDSTTIDGTYYDSVFVRSIDPDSAKYRLGFTEVGAFQGNYQRILNSANGRVYQWIAPANGVKQGNYEPLVLLVTPKKKQMLSMGINRKLNKNGNSRLELSLSNNDVNTFSDKHSRDDTGLALDFDIDQKIPFQDTSQQIIAMVSYRYVGEYFEGIDRFRETEFERNWNLDTENKNRNEQLLDLQLKYNKQNNAEASYAFNLMKQGLHYTGYKNELSASVKSKFVNASYAGNLLQTSMSNVQTKFVRQKADLVKPFTYFSIGVRNELENNKWQNLQFDSLMRNSFAFNQWEVFAQSTDSLKNRYLLSYKNRLDYEPINNQLETKSKAKDLKLQVELLRNRKNQLKIISNYRETELTDTLEIEEKTNEEKHENTLTARLEYKSRWFKNAITTSSFIETGSGLEVKRDFSYLEVAPGQGMYKWIDYNQNQQKELDEFEVARFRDEASFIRVLNPTNQYLKVKSFQLNEAININPARIWRKKIGILKFLSKFSDQLAYNIHSRSTGNRFNIQYLLGKSDNNPELVSYSNSLRNTFSYNKSNPAFGVDYVYRRQNNKSLLVNGFESKILGSNGLHLRWMFTESLKLNALLELGEKAYRSDFFETKNYQIIYEKMKTSLSIQPGIKLSAEISYQFDRKNNNEGADKMSQHIFGTNFKFNIKNSGAVSAKCDVIVIDFNGAQNEYLAYTMLQGLKPGNNATWSFLIQKSLSNGLQLDINYQGRVSETTKVIHMGGMQLRANF